MPKGKGNLVILSDSGDEPPLFCIHGGDGGVLFYRNLANIMSGHFPLLAIESLDLGANTVIEPTSVEETAQAYVQHLIARFPSGPHRIVGYSFGGVVAHEMACVLERMGYRVEFVGLFDTHNHASDKRAYSLYERFQFFWKQNRDAALPARLVRLGMRIIDGIRTDRRVRSEICRAKACGPARAHSDLRRVQVREENWRAMQAYKPSRFSGRLTLFKAITASDKIKWPDDYGWAAFAGGGIEIVPVPGQHLTLFDSRHIATLARKLQISILRSSSARYVAGQKDIS